MTTHNDAIPSLVPQIGHTGHVLSLQFSPDGRRLISWGGDGGSILWDARRLKLLRAYPPGWAAFYRPDGRLALWHMETRGCPAVYEQASLVDAESGAVQATFTHTAEPPALSANGRYAAGIGWHKPCLSDGRTGRVLWFLRHSPYDVGGAAFTPDGSRLVTWEERDIPPWSAILGHPAVVAARRQCGSGDRRQFQEAIAQARSELPPQRCLNTVAIRRLADGRTLHRFLVSDSGPGCRIVLMPSGARLAAAVVTDLARPRSVVKVVDARGCRPWMTLPELESRTSHPMSHAFSPDGDWLATTDLLGRLRCWHLDTATAHDIDRDGHGTHQTIDALAFSPDNRVLAVAGGERVIRLFDVRSGRALGRLDCRPVGIGSPGLAPDGSLVVTADRDNVIRTWDIADAALVARVGRHSHLDGEADSPGVWWPGGTAFWCGARPSPDGRRVASLGAGGSVGCWDAATGKRLWTRRSPERNLTALCWLPDGGRLLTAGWMLDEDRQVHSAVRLRDAANGEEIRLVLRQDRDIRWATVSPDGRCLALVSEDTLLFCDVATGRLEGIDKRFDQHAYKLAFSPDGTMLAFSDAEATVVLWNLAEGKPAAYLDLEAAAAGSVAFSPDGRLLAVGGSYAETIAIFDLASGEMVHVLRGHTSVGVEVAFTPNGRRLVSSSQDCTLRVWDPIRGELLATLCVLPPKTAGGVSEDWIWHSPRGYYDCTPGAQRLVRWQVGGRLLPRGRFKRRFHRPDRLRALLRGSE